MKRTPFTYKVDVPEGCSGNWAVERFTVTSGDACGDSGVRCLARACRFITCDSTPMLYSRLMEPEFMSDALDDLRDDAADFASRQRSATRALVAEYATGHGPAVAPGLASADRALASIDAETKPATPTTDDALAGYDAVLRFYGVDPVALRLSNPFAYLALGQAYFIDLARVQALTQACVVGALAVMRAASEQRFYEPVVGSRNALRHSLHQTGVL